MKLKNLIQDAYAPDNFKSDIKALLARGLSLKNFQCWFNVLGQHYRRWTNSKTAFGECLLGVVSSYNQVIATQLNATSM